MLLNEGRTCSCIGGAKTMVRNYLEALLCAKDKSSHEKFQPLKKKGFKNANYRAMQFRG